MYFKQMPLSKAALQAPLNPGKRNWIAPGTLFENQKSIQDKVCHFCKCAIPAGTPHKYRHMCVYAACTACEYIKEDGNYQ
jgi:hypothetical protein